MVGDNNSVNLVNGTGSVINNIVSSNIHPSSSPNSMIVNSIRLNNNISLNNTSSSGLVNPSDHGSKGNIVVKSNGELFINGLVNGLANTNNISLIGNNINDNICNINDTNDMIDNAKDGKETFRDQNTDVPISLNGLFACEVCDKKFSKLDVLKKHAKSHITCPCTVCNQVFRDKLTLTKHQIEVHTLDKVFQCPQCDKGFKELRTLRLHLKIHNSEYPEQCGVCKKVFRTKWQLKQHLMDHGGERPYPCPECSFTCKTKQQLNEHRRKHSGEKAYSCPQCGTRFTYRNGLIKHTKLNRCPKKIITAEGETIIKKRSRIINKPQRLDGDMSNSLMVKPSPEKSSLDQKILDVIRRRSAMKNQIHISEEFQDVSKLININEEPSATNSTANNFETQFNLDLLEDAGKEFRDIKTSTILTSSTDISSWAATLPAGTKVTVTHYDASKKSGHGELVATPTHTETIIVTPNMGQMTPLQLPKSPMAPTSIHLPTTPLPPSNATMSTSSNVILPRSQLFNPQDTSFGLPSYPESFAVDPNEILQKDKTLTLKMLDASRMSIDSSRMSIDTPSLRMPVMDVNLTAQTLLMRAEPDPQYDPARRIKRETPQSLLMIAEPDPQFDPKRIKMEPQSPPMKLELDSQYDPTRKIKLEPNLLMSPSISTPLSLSLPCLLPPPPLLEYHGSANDIKKEVLDELFDNNDVLDTGLCFEESSILSTPSSVSSQPTVPEMSIKTEDETMDISDPFYQTSFKMEPLSPQSCSSSAESECSGEISSLLQREGSWSNNSDLGRLCSPESSPAIIKHHPSSSGSQQTSSDFSFLHRDLDAIVSAFGKASSAQILVKSSTQVESRQQRNPAKVKAVLPDFDLDFAEMMDEDLVGFSINEQDFVHMQSMVEQTFKDGRDVFDIISSV